jgi:hypothetical protein
MGHFVTATAEPERHESAVFDLIICSHAVPKNPAPKVFISHGVINDESPRPGADRYVSVSEEVRQFHLRAVGIDSEVIGQPIRIMDRKRPGDELQKILIIRRGPTSPDPFAFLSEKYDVRISDPERPIEEQISWADLCITLGRGALESMAQGKPVMVADNRPYIGAYGDGYVTWENIQDIAKCNFSGRRYAVPLTRGWIEAELAKYNPLSSLYVHKYVSRNHNAQEIVARYLTTKPAEKPTVRDMAGAKISFGVMTNDMLRLDMVLRQSEIKGRMHFVTNPESATKGLNKLLGVMEKDGADIAVLCHQDMYFRQGWIDQVKSQLSLLPESWIVAGVIGKDLEGLICGKFHDMRIPLHFNTSHIHDFPHPSCCFDECCIIVNLRKGFRFDEGFDGFDLYGTLCVLQAWEMGGTAWVIDAFAEHYCMRPFSWVPDELFISNYKRLWERFNAIGGRIDSTAIGLSKEDLCFATSAA